MAISEFTSIYLTGTACHLSEGEDLNAKQSTARVSPYFSYCYARGCKICRENSIIDN